MKCLDIGRQANEVYSKFPCKNHAKNQLFPAEHTPLYAENRICVAFRMFYVRFIQERTSSIFLFQKISVHLDKNNIKIMV